MWSPPEGYDLLPTDEDSSDASPGATWDGARFLPPAKPVPDRLTVLLREGPATVIFEAETEAMVDRPAEDIAADKSELLGLLQTKLAASENLTWEEMNKMLALERES